MSIPRHEQTFRISIHAPREGGRQVTHFEIPAQSAFQSTPPARGATPQAIATSMLLGISIHAPREGGDTASDTRKKRPPRYFNPRPPRGGRQFLRPAAFVQRTDFNPRPPRGGRLERLVEQYMVRIISIHAPREGGDQPVRILSDLLRGFQSTPPARGATIWKMFLCHRDRISIHAPREGGDTMFSVVRRSAVYFNPRPPRGGRLFNCHNHFCYAGISIHAPREGGDRRDRCAVATAWYFNPRPPRGGRLSFALAALLTADISIHAPREGGDFAPDLSPLT